MMTLDQFPMVTMIKVPLCPLIPLSLLFIFHVSPSLQAPLF